METSSAIGRRIGPYEIISALGAGGMGEVYRATDTRLKRDVALKILPESFASDPDRLARFQREAEVLASLNHPNIAAIHGLEESNGCRALVMELVEGETLADRIARGAIPLDEALPIAKQMAEALEAAHEQGIIHRDLKPANIKVRPDGTVKVLDFGLAKLGESTAATASQSTLSMSPTITSPALVSGVGMLLGTAAYMAPEQAKGRAADKRCDIWAFGCVLYEMVTGKRAFEGEDVSDTLAGVLRGEPRWEAIPPDTPTSVIALLHACLLKERRERIADIAAALFVLRDRTGLALMADNDAQRAAAASAVANAVHDTRRAALRVLRRWQVAALVLLIAAIVATVSASRRPPDPLKPLLRVDMDLGPDVSLSGAHGQDVAISPDGNRLVYASNGRLYTKLLDRGAVAELKGTEGGFAPFFSPDGRAIAFFAGKELKTLAFDSGLVSKVCNTGTLPKLGTWGDDGNIVADLNLGNVLSIVSASGGMPAPLTMHDEAKHDAIHTTPAYLPGSEAVLFTAVADSGKAEVRAVSMRTHEAKMLHSGFFPRFVATSSGVGFLLFVDGTTVYASRFDVRSLTLASAPTPVLNDLVVDRLDAQLDVSARGRAVAQTLDVSAGRAFVINWMTPAGMMPLVTKPGVYRRPAVSPDSRRIAFQMDNPVGSDSLGEVLIYDMETKSTARLTFNGGELPRWSPDGLHVAYRNNDGLYWIKSDGTGGSVKLTNGSNQFPMSFTPDGRALVFQQTVTSKNDILLVRIPNGPVSQPLKPEVVVQGPFDERQPAISPDGKWLAYASDDTGDYQVYVRPFPNVNGGKWQISAEGGLLYPTWSRSENRLFFRNTGNQLLSSTYLVQNGAFVAQPPTLWSEQRLADLGLAGAQNFDLAPDGRRVAAIMPAPGPSGDARRHTVVLLDNFVDELQRRVPQR